MTSIQTILAATDFSEDADRAAHRAALLAAGHGARLRLLHVVQTDALEELRTRLGLAADVKDRLSEDAGRRLAAIAEKLQKASSVQAECVVRSGRVRDEILAEADHADLLVVGAHGTSRTREALLGTVADRMLYLGRRPILVVRNDPVKDYAKVLVPVDFSVHSIAALQFARRLAPDAQLHVFHAHSDRSEGTLFLADAPREAIEKHRSASRNAALENVTGLVGKALPGDPRVTWSVDDGDAKFLISEEAKRQGADVIVMGKHGHSLLSELFLGSSTHATVARAHCDVAVVPQDPRI